MREAEENVRKVWEKLGLSPDDYMMVYWDIPNGRVMAIPHVGYPHACVGVIYDVKTDTDGSVLSFKFDKEGVQS